MKWRVLWLTLACFVSPLCTASAILTVQSGVLVGASNVDVGGALYNVSFVDGTCVDLFDGCDEVSDFTFRSEIDATNASQALLDQVFVDVAAGLFDANPPLTSGCENQFTGFNCIATTPYGLHPTSAPARLVVAAVNRVGPGNGFGLAPQDDTIDSRDFHRLDDFTVTLNAVWAVWTPVPEPATTILLVFGLLGAVFTRRAGV
jgi:hypothetical protein